MFGRKEKPKRQRPAGSLAQYGIFEVPENISDIGSGFNGGDDDDEDLEAELAALTSGSDLARQDKRKAARKPMPTEDLDAMVAESMKDVNLDDNASDGEDDPDLLNELQMITGESSDTSAKNSPEQEEPDRSDTPDNAQIIKTLQERLMLYQKAESKAKERDETGKARRYNRGIKTLQSLLHDAQAGKNIDEADIPPELPPSATADIVEQPAASAEETIPPAENDAPPGAAEGIQSEPAATTPVDQEMLELLKSRQQEYKVAALISKKSGNMKDAIQFMNIYKQFDNAIAAVNEGAVIDPTEIPPPPSSLVLSADNTPVQPSKEESEVQQKSLPETPSVVAEAQPSESKDLGTALKERLEIYRRTKTAAEAEGNSSKARRYGRICKQFEDAIKLHARGKPVVVDELPVPPGFPPLSSQSAAAAPEAPKEAPQPAPQIPSGSESSQDNTVPQRPKPPTPPPRSHAGKKPAQRITSRAEKQLQILQQRIQELKQAALTAKKDGDIELARDYLRQAKGIQPLIEASKGGLPVDMNSIPLSPLAKKELSAHSIAVPDEESFTLVSSIDCTEEAEGTDEQIYENLEAQLTKQIKWCLSTRNHCKALGDVPGYNRWERLALGYTRDLDMLRVRKRDLLPPPQHHYETKTYAIVQSCTDLNDGDIELSIIRGVNYSKEADTYVMFEFPYPSDNPPSDRTSTIKGSSNPEYEAVFPLAGIIDRSSRQCQRAFKRHALKCQVWVKGCSLNPLLCCTNPRGLFRSDTLLGTVTVKLQALETQCVLHDSFPLMDGRKATGGKLELKIRLRNPILTKQIEQITDKWLALDH